MIPDPSIDKLHILRRREKFIMVMFYEGYNYTEIADTFRINRGRARQIVREYRQRYAESDIEKELTNKQ